MGFLDTDMEWCEGQAKDRDQAQCTFLDVVIIIRGRGRVEDTTATGASSHVCCLFTISANPNPGYLENWFPNHQTYSIHYLLSTLG